MPEEQHVNHDATDEEILDGWPEDRPEVPDLLGPCPAWCAGRPHLENISEYPCDQAHESAREEFDVDVTDGRTELSADAQIVWQPYSELPGGRVPCVYLHWQDETRALSPDDVLAVADGIETWAGRLREIAEQLRGILAGELPEQGDLTMRT